VLAEVLAQRMPADFPGRRYAVLLHATSATIKEWPEPDWADIGRRLAEDGIASVLPFGSEAERLRSDRLAAAIPGALVPPRLDLDLLAALLSGAVVVIGVDTGLSHLSVALGKPTIGIYCTTEPAATGLYGGAAAVNLGGPDRTPKADQVWAAAQSLRERN
jgi:heptosyltransferase-1